MRLALLAELLRNLGVGHQEPYEVGLIGRAAEKLFPLLDPMTWCHVSELHSCSAPLFDPSALLIESSRCVSNTTSIMWLLTPSCKMWVTAESASWDNVWSLPFIFWTRFMPSMIVAEGSGMASAGNTCLSNSLTRTALFVFLIVPSPLASAHGNGPSGWHRSSWDGGFLPPGPCRQVDSCQLVEWRCLSGLQKSSFGYFKTYRASSSSYWSTSRSRLNSSYAAVPNLCASMMSQATFRWAVYLSKCWQTHFHLGRKGSSSHCPEAWQWTERQLHPYWCAGLGDCGGFPPFVWAVSGTYYGTQKWGDTSPQQPVSG